MKYRKKNGIICITDLYRNKGAVRPEGYRSSAGGKCRMEEYTDAVFGKRR